MTSQTANEQGRAGMRPAHWIAAAAVAVGLALLFWPLAEGAAATPVRAGGLIIATVGLWATHAIPEHITSLAFMLLAVILGIAAPDVAFSGFAGGAVWLLFGGIIIGLAVSDSGLGRRIARSALRGLTRSYVRAVWGLMAACLLLAFLMPASIGRIVILMPIALALADQMGFAPGSRGRTGFALTIGFGSFVPTFAILPANLPNVVLFGAAETIYGVVPTYAEYLLWHLPVMGVLRAVALVLIILAMFPDRARPPEAEAVPAPMSARQRNLLIVLCLTLGLWATDFIHHISPAWVALLAAIVILVPAFDLAPPTALADKTNLQPFFFVAGVLGVGALVADSGLGAEIADFLGRWVTFDPARPFLNYLSLIGVSMVFGTAATVPGAPTFLVPLAQDVSAASGMSLMTVLMTQIVGLSAMLLPYQSPPLVVAIGLGGVRIRDALRVILASTAATLVVLAPLNFLWWRLLGLFG
ncbi:MAG: anion permease [Rhodospirillales bacterium]|nr:MAG: anion permease [Rhodospirillales bacterium]